MVFIEILKAICLGIVEGITEWLPISSTGHMILIEKLIQINASVEFKEMFFVVIQLGAILSVVFLYFNKLNPFSNKKSEQEVIDKSKALLGNEVQEFKAPRVIGLDIYEAREDLEGLGLKVTVKLEKPSLEFVSKEDGQVTRVTYPNNQKIGSKFKTGDRVWLYYVNEKVILELINTTFYNVFSHISAQK